MSSLTSRVHVLCAPSQYKSTSGIPVTAWGPIQAAAHPPRTAVRGGCAAPPRWDARSLDGAHPCSAVASVSEANASLALKQTAHAFTTRDPTSRHEVFPRSAVVEAG